MSTPSSTKNPVAWHDASAYAAAVRSYLDDLSPDVVEELAGGLEADLTDLAAESPEPLGSRLGDPAGYAAELRAAAGLGPRVAPGRVRVLDPFRDGWRDVAGSLRSKPWWARAASIAHDLRPVWWVARAWVAWKMVVSALGLDNPYSDLASSFGTFMLLLLFVAGSVALERGLFRESGATGALVRAGNVLAVLLLLPALAIGTAGAADGHESYGYPDPQLQTGLVNDGNGVTNVFPYGPDGQPLRGVTLLDQDGDPLAVDPTLLAAQEEGTTAEFQVPGYTLDGEVRWNVFPQGSAQVDAETFWREWGANDGYDFLPGAEFTPAAPPRIRVPAVLVDPAAIAGEQPVPGSPSGSVTTPPTEPPVGGAPTSAAPTSAAPTSAAPTSLPAPSLPGPSNPSPAPSRTP